MGFLRRLFGGAEPDQRLAAGPDRSTPSYMRIESREELRQYLSLQLAGREFQRATPEMQRLYLSDLTKSQTLYLHKFKGYVGAGIVEPMLYYRFSTQRDAVAALATVPLVEHDPKTDSVAGPYTFGIIPASAGAEATGHWDVLIAGPHLTADVWRTAKLACERFGGRLVKEFVPEDLSGLSTASKGDEHIAGLVDASLADDRRGASHGTVETGEIHDLVQRHLDRIGHAQPDLKGTIGKVIAPAVEEAFSVLVLPKLNLTVSERKPHSAAGTFGELLLVISTFAMALSQMPAWYGTEYGGYLAYLDRILQKMPVPPNTHLLCHLAIGIDGNQRWVQVCIRPILDGNQPIAAVVLPADFLTQAEKQTAGLPTE